MLSLMEKLWRPACVIQFLILLGIYTLLGLASAPQETVGHYNDKLMHFTGYLVAGISISMAWPLSLWWHRALFLLTYSTAIECLQYFLPTRSFSLLDIVANTSGLLLGLVIFELFKAWAPEKIRRWI